MTDEKLLDEIIDALYIVQADRCVTKEEEDEIEEVVNCVRERLKENYPWIEITDDKNYPEHLNLVIAALYDAKKNSFCYYIGFYNKDTKQWYLNDYGYTESVTHWMPIPKIKSIEIK